MDSSLSTVNPPSLRLLLLCVLSQCCLESYQIQEALSLLCIFTLFRDASPPPGSAPFSLPHNKMSIRLRHPVNADSRGRCWPAFLNVYLVHELGSPWSSWNLLLKCLCNVLNLSCTGDEGMYTQAVTGRSNQIPCWREHGTGQDRMVALG